MTDGEAIMQAMNLYALAIDSKQFHIWDQVFTADVEVDYPVRRWSGLRSWREDFSVSHQRYDATQHLVLNVNWAVSDDTGQALSQGLFHLIHRGLPGGEMVTGGAWYDDELRRTVDGWRISKRICRLVWISGNAAVMGPRAPEGLTSMPEGLSDGTLPFMGALERGLGDRP